MVLSLAVLSFPPMLGLAAESKPAASESKPTADASTPQTKAPRPERAIEEITVTAQRRTETLQEVPVSVAVVSADMIKNQNLTNLDDLSNYVPGLRVIEGGEQTGISVRGFGAGLNFGFDQSVGLFVDGIYAGRERQFRGTFLDVKSVEVLRGPQGSLFGKNTVAGAIIVNTGTPIQEWESSVRAEYSPDTNRHVVEGVVNVPISETFGARMALRASDDKGYLQNKLTRKDEEDVKDFVFRTTFQWTPTDDLVLRTKAEFSDYNRKGRNFQVSKVRPELTNAAGAARLVSALPAGYQFYFPGFDPQRKRERTEQQEQSADVKSQNVSITADYTLGNATLTSITGYSAYKSDDQRDVDFSPTNFLYEPITQDFDQWSQELRLVSNPGEHFDWIAGVFWFKTDFLQDRRTDVNREIFLDVGNAFLNLVPADDPSRDGVPFSAPDLRISNSNLRFFDQTAETISPYFRGTWHVTPAVDLAVGVRYNRERKKIKSAFNRAQFGTSRFLDPNDPTDAMTIAAAAQIPGAGINPQEERGGVLVERDLSPEAKLSWQVNSDTLLYYGVTRGFKSGGFNANSVTDRNEAAALGRDDFVFESENVTAHEIGSKLQLFDDTVAINMALFHQRFKNLQTAVFTGNGFDVGNQGSSFSRGLELEGRWLVGAFDLNAAAIFNDAKFASGSKQAACNIAQINFGAPGCVPNPATGALATGTQSLNGKRFAPRAQYNFGVGYTHTLGSKMDLLMRADVNHFAKGENARDNSIVQPRLTLLDLQATVRSSDGKWTAGVILQNAMNRKYYNFEFEAPAQAGTRIGFLGAPRRVTFRVSYNF
jgi:outer membrane receptor protein involved in Fe transport